MEYGDFKYYVGETLEYCQTIEHDVKWIYAVMLQGDHIKNFANITKWTLGVTVNKLEKLDNSDGKPFLAKGDYDLLRTITTERDYLAHQIFRDFVYVENYFYSLEYKKASTRLMNFHDKIANLQQNIENVRLEAVEKYRG